MTTPAINQGTRMYRNPSQCNRQTQRSSLGFTLVECMVSLAVVAVSVGTAVPSWKQASERRQLEGASAQLATDIRLARSSAVALSAPVRLSFHQSNAGSCYLLHTGRAADCQCTASGTAVCTAGAQVIRAVGFAAEGDLRVTSNSASMLFDADRGTVTPTGTLNLQLRSGTTIRQVVNIMGRARSCTPSADMPAYPAC
jgi:type IV fimbrial biogenesis protein FimT